jgi:hypothetical protein
MPSRVERAFGTSRPLIGVVHLPPLPGYAGCPGMPALIEHALADLEAFQRGGLAGVLVENEHDRPHRVEAARETIASIAVITRELVRAASSIAVGVEILLNDPEASLAAALAAGQHSSAPTTSRIACRGPGTARCGSRRASCSPSGRGWRRPGSSCSPTSR